MRLHLMAGTLLTLLSFSSWAETCPSVYDIKQHALHGFIVLDSVTDKAVPSTDAKRFTENIRQFVLAEWVNKDPNKSVIHCFYRNQDGETSNAYLSKANLAPKNRGRYWYPVSQSMHCAASSLHCAFEPSPGSGQLARRT